MSNRPFPPADFPIALYEEISGTLERFREEPAYKQFVGAWNAVKYRYAAMVELDGLFTKSVKVHGAGPSQPARYEQERDLFGFASNAYSMFDAFHYAMFAIGALLCPVHFKLTTLDDERRVSFRSTWDAYNKAFPEDPVLNHFAAFSGDEGRVDLDKMRNMLTHRATPLRAFQIGADDQPPAKLTRLDIPLNDQTTRLRCQEAHRLLLTCLDTSSSFVKSRI